MYQTPLNNNICYTILMSAESPIPTPHVEFNFDSIKEECDFSITPEARVENARRLLFAFKDGVEVHVRILLNDETGSDVVITNMTTSKVDGNNDVTRKGYGSKAVSAIIRWGRLQNLHEIRATQVGDHVREFWLKNGFTEILGSNVTKDYVYRF